jgi:hypothetical protein
MHVSEAGAKQMLLTHVWKASQSSSEAQKPPAASVPLSLSLTASVVVVVGDASRAQIVKH